MSTAAGSTVKPGAPRCSNCGQDLTGCVAASKCPECGRPLVEVLVREGGSPIRSRRWNSKATFFGVPAISIALGPGLDGKPGFAKGWIAIGDRAFGAVALGGIAMGGATLGGVSLGLCGAGGVALGLFLALGGTSIAPLGLALGGCAIGLVAIGGLAIGGATIGGMGIGLYAWAPGPGAARATYTLLMGRPELSDPQAVAFFSRLTWLLGPVSRRPNLVAPFLWGLFAYVGIALALAVPALARYWFEKEDDARDPSRRS